jgi:hypothetical protein
MSHHQHHAQCRNVSVTETSDSSVSSISCGRPAVRPSYVIGPQGSRGLRGVTGSTGPTGANGAEGPTGPAGTAFPNAIGTALALTGDQDIAVGDPVPITIDGGFNLPIDGPVFVTLDGAGIEFDLAGIYTLQVAYTFSSGDTPTGLYTLTPLAISGAANISPPFEQGPIFPGINFATDYFLLEFEVGNVPSVIALNFAVTVPITIVKLQALVTYLGTPTV